VQGSFTTETPRGTERSRRGCWGSIPHQIPEGVLHTGSTLWLVGGESLSMELFDSPPGLSVPSEGGSTGSHRALLQSGPTDWVSGTGSQGPGGQTPAPRGGPRRPLHVMDQRVTPTIGLQTGSQGLGLRDRSSRLGLKDWVSRTGSQGLGLKDRVSRTGSQGPGLKDWVSRTGSQGPGLKDWVSRTGSQGAGCALLVITDLLVKARGKPAGDQSTLQHSL
jgi:hypothetical protein